jgi:hypothetical protein
LAHYNELRKLIIIILSSGCTELIIGVFARPLYSALLCIRNNSISLIDFLHSIFCGHAATLRAVQAHNDLAHRFNTVNGEEENNLAMAPLLNEPRLRTRIATIQRQVDDLQAATTPGSPLYSVSSTRSGHPTTP